MTTVSPQPGRAAKAISVGNTGQPITPDDVDWLFQPFQRLGSERIDHDGGHGDIEAERSA
jgi:hypothetical protein